MEIQGLYDKYLALTGKRIDRLSLRKIYVGVGQVLIVEPSYFEDFKLPVIRGDVQTANIPETKNKN